MKELINMYCSKCGQENNNDNMYCVKCRNVFNKAEFHEQPKPKAKNIFTRKIPMPLAILVILFFLFFGFPILRFTFKPAVANTNYNYIYTTQPEIIETADPNAKWNEVVEFKGNALKTTNKFTISSNQWRIKWYASKGEYDFFTFDIYLYHSDGSIKDVVANATKPGADENYLYEPGEYYLQINSAGDYTVTVEEFN